MLVAQALPFRYRASVNFKNTAERARIRRLLNELPGRVHIFESNQFNLSDTTYGRMICDFERPDERDLFSKITSNGIPRPVVFRRRWKDAEVLAA